MSMGAKVDKTSDNRILGLLKSTKIVRIFLRRCKLCYQTIYVYV